MTAIDERKLRSGWKQALIDWASGNEAVRELWVFGSRGPKGGSKPESDLDVGIVLAPKIGDHDWALGNYFALGDRWQAELAAIVGRHVSLQAMITGNDGDTEIRSTGARLWERTSSGPLQEL